MAVEKYFISRLALILSITIIVTVFITCGDDDKSLNPGDGQDIVDEFNPDTVLFVMPGGTGNGTSNNPLGSIQAAIDTVGSNGGSATIFVASGEFHESIIINHGVRIYGGLNPDSGWKSFDDDMTVIYGDMIDGEAVAVFIHDVEAVITIDNVIITAHNAIYPGRSSYGVICSRVFGVNNVKFTNCVIIAGNGTDGIAGQEGIDGMNGEDAYYSAPGQVPISGGGGGRGAEDRNDLAEPGDTGFCADGTRSGGAGAANSSQAGEDGPDGYDGINGSCPAESLSIIYSDYLPLLASGNGGDGTDGASGCGGGGGSGAGVTFAISGYDPGGWGGGGGAGGTGGTAGGGGGGGGCSIAVLCSVSALSLSN
ncbi:MAG: hypothetical protein AB1746_05840, partial [Candidatus Zixiibacteriota bacterium]